MYQDGNYRTEDEVNENKIAELVSARWKCELIRQDHYDSFDYIAMRNGEILSFVEVRSRTHEYGKFPDCFISLTKMLRANELTQTTGMPCFFVVSWTDRVGWINLDFKPRLVRSGKEWSRRNNPKVSELLGSIPIEKFVMFN